MSTKNKRIKIFNKKIKEIIKNKIEKKVKKTKIKGRNQINQDSFD